MPISLHVRAKINDAALRGVIAKLGPAEGYVAELAASAVEAKAKANAPVRTGHLQESIEKHGSGNHWIVVALAFYSAFVEWGTRFMAARPFMRPALDGLRMSDILRAFFRRIGL